MNLSDSFDQLADRPVLPVSNHSLSLSTGWSCDDLGGDGLCLMDAFEMHTASTSCESTPARVSSESQVEPIRFEDLPTVHPNKVFALAVQYINRKAPQLSQSQRSQKHKAPQWLLLLRSLNKDLMTDVEFNLTWRGRADAYYMMTAWMSRLCGRSIREV